MIKSSQFETAATQAGASPISLFESISLLNECRDMAVDNLGKNLSQMLVEMEAMLFELADKTFDRNLANAYLDARQVVQQHRLELEGQFRHALVAAFNEKLSQKSAEKPVFGRLSSDALELSLVANDEFESQLAIDDMAGRFRSASGNELFALDQRMGALLQKDVDDRDNPLGPSAIAQSFNEACEALDLSGSVKRIMLEQFNQRFIETIPQFYRTLNQHLIQRNIVPVISSLPKKPPQQAAKKPGTTPQMAQETAQAPAEMPPVAQLAQALEQGDWMQVMSSLMTSGRLGEAMPMAMNPAPATRAAESVELTATHLLNQLSRMQHSDVAALANTASPANILRNLKPSIQDAGAADKEAVTIDIVSMLFDYIFEDKSIPDGIKAMIGRLQIPLLKVAILDNRFFSKKTHPARKLLDTLAAASVGLDVADEHAKRLEAKVSAVVQHILDHFDDDIEVFTAALADLERFLVEEEERAAAEAARAAKLIFDREKLELARVMATEELRNRVRVAHAPEFIAKFLQEPWAQVAAKRFVEQGGETGDAWKAALQSADDLLWSLQPKTSVEDRMRLVSLLPALLRGVEEGLSSINHPKSEKDAFFAELVKYHAQAIKSGVSKPQEPARTVAAAVPAGKPLSEPMPAAATVAPAAAPVAKPIPHKPLPSPLLAQLKSLDAESDPLAGSLAASVVANESAPLEVVTTDTSAGTELKRGSQVEFLENGNWRPMKLLWVSPLQSTYVFTQRDGQALSIEKADFEARVVAGTARHVQRGAALFDRAMSSMVNQLTGGQSH